MQKGHECPPANQIIDADCMVVGAELKLRPGADLKVGPYTSP